MNFGSLSALEGVSFFTHHHYHCVCMVCMRVHVYVCEYMFKSRNVYSCLGVYLCESVCVRECMYDLCVRENVCLSVSLHTCVKVYV